MVIEQSSSPRAYTYTIGYALQPSKVESVIQPSLVALVAERGMRLVAIDASRPLADQGPFHLIIHKRYDLPAWRAELEAFSALHPSVPVVDAPAAIDRLLDRLSMLDAVSQLTFTANIEEGGQERYSLDIPRQVAVHDAAAIADPEYVPPLRFPLIAKPLAVDGSAGSHAMVILYRHEGLRGLHPPLVLQEFVNHGGVLFKVYVIGDRATCVRRNSLPDVPKERLLDLELDPSVPFANVSSLPAPSADAQASGAETMMPPAGFVDEVARGLRRAMGLHLFNFDMIRASELDGGTRRFFLVDINYFPGYAKMPGYETALTDFFSEMLRASDVVVPSKPGPGASPGTEVCGLDLGPGMEVDAAL